MRWIWIFVLAALLPAALVAANPGQAPRVEVARGLTTVTLPAASPARSEAPIAPSDSLGALAQLTGAVTGGGEFLPPDEAFRFSLEAQDAETLIARWQVVDGYYLYRDKMRFSLKRAQGVFLSDVSLPDGVVETDEFFGRVEIYPQDTEILVPLKRADGGARRVTVETQYQGCAEAGLCYPPITKEVSLKLPASGAGAAIGSASSSGAATAAGAATTGAALSAQAPPVQSEQDRLAGQLAAGGIWLNVIAFFGAGLLLAFTPCVFPMIPILSGVIAGQSATIDTGKAFMLSLTFVLAMAVTYTVAGVIVGLSGDNVQALFQNPWVLSIFAGVFVLLALSMFGFYDLQMPAAVQTRLTTLSGRQEGGTFIGAGIMGFLSALIVGPCVTAPLIGALLYIAQTGDAVLGGIALFALALGMGAPLLVIGTSAGRLIPKAGPWMDTVKAIFGVLMLGVAIWLLERILPAALTMGLWALLLIVSGIYVGAFDTIRDSASGWFRLWKGLGIAMSVYGALLLVGAAGGGHDVLQPLKGMAAADDARNEGLEFERIKGPTDLQQAVATAAAEGRPVMLDFYADWCVACKEMEKYTFGDRAVQAALSNAVLLQADVTDNDAQDQALLRSLGLFGPPAILFYTPDGEEQSAFRVVGFVPAEEFSRHVRQAVQSQSS